MPSSGPLSRIALPWSAAETDTGPHMLTVGIVYNAVPATTDVRRSLGTWMEP